MAIFVITTLCGDDISLLPHWREHYARFSDHVIVCGSSEQKKLMPDIVSDIIDTDTAMGQQQHGAQMHVLHRHGLELDRDWIMIADIDEFYVFPAPLETIVNECAAKGLEAVFGHFVDMVATNGELAPVRADAPIWRQFPIETRFTEAVMGGGISKVMLHRPWISVTPGHHVALSASVRTELRRVPPIGELKDYKVLHYKWKAGLADRLRWALSKAVDHRWADEARKTLLYLRDHGGKIDLNDPSDLTDMSRCDLSGA